MESDAAVHPGQPAGTEAADVGRYVLAAQRTEVKPVGMAKISEPAGPIRFYQFSIGSSGQVSAPRLLPALALPAGTSLTGLALTPDGRKLAVASQPARPGRDPEIQVDTLATGAQRAWTWPGGQPIEESTGGTGSAVSWAADDSTLAFQRWVDDRFQVRLLDTTAPGSSLAGSRVALRLKMGWQRQPVLPWPRGQRRPDVRRPAHAGRQQDRLRYGHPDLAATDC